MVFSDQSEVVANACRNEAVLSPLQSLSVLSHDSNLTSS